MSIFHSIASRITCKATGLALSLTAGSFPHAIRIECTNACNASCIICPHKTMKRPIAVMPDDLYERIVDECGRNRCHEIHLHNFGEPLLDEKLESRIRRAKKAGIGKVKIFSNASLLTEDRSRGLIEAGLDEIAVSFDGESPDEYERIRQPLKFNTVVDNLRALINLRNEMRSHLRVRITCCCTGDIEKTIALLPKEGVDKFSFGKLHNWATEDYASLPKIKKACSRVWNTFTILSSGEVALCCLDYDGRVILGNLNSGHSIREIFRNTQYRRIRRLHSNAKQEEIPQCASCSKSFI